MPERVYRVLDLFAGAGGFSLGFKRFEKEGLYPFELAGAVEYDQNAANTLVSALIRRGLSEEEAGRRVVCGDITLKQTKELLYKNCKSIDIILGGPPCQSFSTIGPRSGDREKQERFADDQRDFLFDHYIQIVTHYEPAFFVFENVKGILSKYSNCGRKYIDIITEAFAKLGYCLDSVNPDIKTPYIVLNAADYGVPQLRERVFIIGNRLKIKNPYPKKTHCSPNVAQTKSLLPYVTLNDAIGDLPPVYPKITFTPAKKGMSDKDLSETQKERINRRNLIRDCGQDSRLYHIKEFEEHLKCRSESGQRFLEFIKPQSFDSELTGHIARGQQRSDIILFRGLDQGTSTKHLLLSNRPRHKRILKLVKYKMSSFQDKYKKLAWDKPCGTIFAHMQKDGNRFIHPDSRQARTLTVRETARIQSFPDDYVFEAVGHVRYKYIGNAVPPLLSRAIAESVYESLVEHQRMGETCRLSRILTAEFSPLMALLLERQPEKAGEYPDVTRFALEF